LDPTFIDFPGPGLGPIGPGLDTIGPGLDTTGLGLPDSYATAMF